MRERKSPGRKSARFTCAAWWLGLAALSGASASFAQEGARPLPESERGGIEVGLGLQLSGVDASDATGGGLAFVELETARDTYLLQEPIELYLRFGFEAGFASTNLVQLFQRSLDVPVQVQAPWIEHPEGMLPLAPEDGPEEAPPGLSFVLNESVARAQRGADRVIGGRVFVVYECARAYLPTRTGPLEIPAPILRFAHAALFEDDFVHGRVARERHDALVRGAGLALVIQPLPEEGRPPEFSGAVGQFTLRATAEPRELELGSNLELVLSIEGRGDLAHFAAPHLEGLADFYVQGELEESGAARRTITYHLAPRRAGRIEVPPIRFAFFDPLPPAGYRTLASEPIAVVVRPAAGTPEVEAGTAPGEPTRAASGTSQAPPPPAEERPLRWLFVGLLVLALGWGVVRGVRARSSA